MTVMLPDMPNGAITTAPIARPTPRPLRPRSSAATRRPMTMYAAHIADEQKMKNRPIGSPPISTPERTATPDAAIANAIVFRRVRVSAAATAIGPMNSSTTLLPSGSRSMAK
ncbi:unannotated protein [freshwater metagenome]|uniref:Unannotated protein n=1 Tax=freshwater metagenome TaxID=449393 RepID=A0A6J7IWU9_9ZZZZ